MRSKRATSGNLVIPNSFQFPNILADRLMFFLTPQEWKVLSFAVRQILGFQTKIASRQDRISLTQFVSGKTSVKDGSSLCLGCGLSKPTITTALSALWRYGILIQVGAPSRNGQLYELQEDVEKIDWLGLETRKMSARARAQLQTVRGRVEAKSTEAVERKRASALNSAANVRSMRLTGKGSMGLTDRGQSDLPPAVNRTERMGSMALTHRNSKETKLEIAVETSEFATADSRIREHLEALRAIGIEENKRTAQIARMSHVNPAFIRERFDYWQRKVEFDTAIGVNPPTIGILIVWLETGEALPALPAREKRVGDHYEWGDGVRALPRAKA